MKQKISTAITKKRQREEEIATNRIPQDRIEGSSSDLHDDFYTRAAKWRLEQDYEQRPRKHRKKDNEPTKLPIKTSEGLIEPSILTIVDKEDESSILSVGDDEVVSQTEKVPEEEPPVLSSQEQIINAQEELARIASQINQSPEEHASLFRPLSQLAESPNPVIKKLALATQMAVYKDVIPGYRIRPLGDTNTAEKLTKEVKRLRNYEQGLVSSYQNYLRQLARAAKHHSEDRASPTSGVAQVAISCACSLLLAVPHFNFRGDLLNILIATAIARQRSPSSQKCIQTLEELFRDDEDGQPSLEAMNAISKAIKAREYLIDEGILNTFLHLRLLGTLSVRASYDKVDRSPEKAERQGKAMKQKREFRTKKQRKVLKEQKKVEKDFIEADAIVDHEERERIQSETLKLVFVIYFRILKARIPSLMGAVLEGLSKYTHLVNQDFFGDILEALKDLIETSQHKPDDAESEENLGSPQTTSSLRRSLLCVTTAFTLLSHQDVSPNASSAALALDLSFFTAHLYRILYALSLDVNLEVSSKTPLLSDPNHPNLESIKPKVNASTMSVLLLRSLDSILLPRSTPPIRVAAYIKALLTSTLQMPEKSTVALLALLQQIIRVHVTKMKGLWDTDERKGNGVFDPHGADIEGSNPFAGTIWDGELMRLHYSPKVQEGIKGIDKVLKERR